MKREEIRRTGGKKRGFDGTIYNQRWLIKESGLSWCILSLSVLVVKRRGTWKYVLFSRRGVCWNFVARKLWLEKYFLWNFPQVLMWISPPFYMNTKRKRKIELEIVEISEWLPLPPNISNMRVYTLWAVSSAWDEMNHNTWLLWQVHWGRFG